jgi:hypothetical protein
MSKGSTSFRLSEDWWAVIIAFVLILLATLGWLGEGGLMIKF